MQIQNHRLIDIPFTEAADMGGPLAPKYIIMHYTASGSFEGSLSWLTGGNGVSAHVLIGRDGTTHQMLPFNRVAYHAGQSEWDGKTGMNNHAIGIEMVNWGRLDGERRTWTGRSLPALDVQYLRGTYWHGYTSKQYIAAAELVAALIRHYGIPMDRTHIIGHDEVAPQRKTDPGPAWDWEHFMGKLALNAGHDYIQDNAEKLFGPPYSESFRKALSEEVAKVPAGLPIMIADIQTKLDEYNKRITALERALHK